MYACSGHICDALCCCFSYHALLSLHYESHPTKTAATKKLAQEVGISVREAERHLEVDVFLDKYPRWEPGRLHCLFLLQWMLTHARATRQKEQDHAIHWGHQQPLPEWDLSAEVPPVELVASKPPRRRSKWCTMKYTSWKECLEQNHAMWRWQRLSAKKSSTLSRSTSIVGGIVCSQWRNQGKDPPVPLGQTPSVKSSERPVPPTTTSGI